MTPEPRDLTERRMDVTDMERALHAAASKALFCDLTIDETRNIFTELVTRGFHVVQIASPEYVHLEGTLNLSFVLADPDRYISLIEERSFPEPMSGCWLWAAKWGGGGYGYLDYKGRHNRAHRVSFVAHNRRLPVGGVVRHRCDTRVCVNPAHLTEGTIGDNNRDKAARGRHTQIVGAANVNSKFGDDVAREIILSYRTGLYTQAELGRRYGVSGTIIGKMVSRKSWKHVHAQIDDELRARAG